MQEKEAWMLSKIVFSMVIIMGILVFSTLFQRPTSLEISPAQRGPSSVIQIDDVKHDWSFASKALVSTLELDCVGDDKRLRFKSESNQFRFVGALCREGLALKNLLIENKSNGSSGTLFQLPNQRFTTDFIVLKDGPNEIIISEVLEGEESPTRLSSLLIEKTENIVIDEDRNPASATDSK